MDVIELGKPGRQPRPPRPPRRGWPLGLAALVALAVVAYLGTQPEQPPRATPSPSPVVIVPPLETVPPVIDETPVPDEPNPTDPTWTGEWQPADLAEHTGLVLVPATHTFHVVDADTGRSTTLFTPDGDVTVHPIGRIEGGWLAMTFGVCEEVCTGPLYAVRGRTATPIGEGIDARLDPDGRTVWLVVAEGNTAGTRLSLDRRTFDGDLVSTTKLTTEEELYGVTPAGPLVGWFGEGAAVLDARTGRRRTVLPDGRSVIAVAGDLVANVTQACWETQDGCVLHVTNVRTGADRRIPRPKGVSGLVALDPLGRYVAFARGEDGKAVHVYDLRSGEEVPIAGLGAPPAASAMRWSPDGRWLVLTHPVVDDAGQPLDANRVVVWRPGLSRPRELPDLDGSGPIDVLVETAR